MAFHSRLRRPKKADLLYCFEGHPRANVAGVVDSAGDLAESMTRRAGFARLLRDIFAEDFGINRIGFGAECVAIQDAELACGIAAGQIVCGVRFRESLMLSGGDRGREAHAGGASV
jgi:hypothetical protein